MIDTHIWVWFQLDDPRLSPRTADEIGRLGPEVVLSAISVYEATTALQRGRIESQLDPAATVNAWLLNDPFRIEPVGVQVALLARTLSFDHQDPLDRLIAATAVHLNMPLATADDRLTRLEWLATIS